MDLRSQFTAAIFDARDGADTTARVDGSAAVVNIYRTKGAVHLRPLRTGADDRWVLREDSHSQSLFKSYVCLRAQTVLTTAEYVSVTTTFGRAFGQRERVESDVGRKSHRSAIQYRIARTCGRRRRRIARDRDELHRH